MRKKPAEALGIDSRVLLITLLDMQKVVRYIRYLECHSGWTLYDTMVLSWGGITVLGK
jgi:hypothetical protein